MKKLKQNNPAPKLAVTPTVMFSLNRNTKAGQVIESRDDLSTYQVTRSGFLIKHGQQPRRSKKQRLKENGGGKWNFKNLNS